MERGSSKHGARQDDALAADLEGQLGPGGSNREEWVDPEPPADDDPPAASSGYAVETAYPGGDDQDDAEMRRVQRDIDVANDWGPARDATS